MENDLQRLLQSRETVLKDLALGKTSRLINFIINAKDKIKDKNGLKESINTHPSIFLQAGIKVNKQYNEDTGKVEWTNELIDYGKLRQYIESAISEGIS